MTRTAQWWRPLENGQAACDLCPIGCRLRPGQTGPCGTRENRDRVMEPLYYGRVVSGGMDPIEKKPLYHFLPGRPVLSVAAPGCNLHCLFCQNWSISQGRDQVTSEASPRTLVETAREQGSLGIAYTYSEPLVWYEFVLDTAREVRKAGLRNVLVTNGFLNRKPLAELLPLIDAANIDLKSLDDRFYRRICKARLEPVLEAIAQFHAAGVHVEITNLVIPGHNDSDDQIGRLVDFVAGLDRNIPLHFSAYHPAWKLNAPPTPTETLLRAHEIASRQLDWVYLGNVAVEAGRDTVCHRCGKPAIVRTGFRAQVDLGPDSACKGCGAPLPVICS